MTEFSQLSSQPRRPLRTFIGSSVLALHSLGPLVMVYIYYLAILGSIPCIIISLLQIAVQICVNKKYRWYISFLQWSDIELFFKEFTFETEEPIIDDSRSLFAAHPHGVFSLGLFLNNHRDHFGKNAVVCGSRIVMITPIMGMLHKMAGMVSVNADSLKHWMAKGTNVALLPGGFEEATLTTPKENRIFIKHRKGFIKYAMRYGYRVYPVFVFGENKMYKTFDRFQKFRLFLNKLKLVGVIFWSKYGVFPDIDLEIRTVVGKPIELPKLENPSDEQINQYHEIYIQKLTELYEKYAVKYNIKDELKIL